MWARRPRVDNGPCIVDIDHIVIREVQYQLEANLCINEEVNFQGSCSCANSVGDSSQDGRTDGGDKRQFGAWGLSMTNKNQRTDSTSIDLVVIRDFKGSSANSVGGDSGHDGRTDKRWR
ncbi:hypothetical protein DPMN_051810 [Dreissena polymorpha]|uniref:Uncharacterized protein n=1 Tax=Dreissena polymorpha TaxID=45954 RepID=A0A9D4CII2_DREPO|nr:hypothetical protein DPMN_051810 [Dreissena polymorpha]